MKANFIRTLCENEIQTTELALAVSSISSDIQSMIEKLSNIKVKDVSELTKKIKYDGDIDAGENFYQSIGSKIDQAIQSLTEIKSDIDNEVVNISQGGSVNSDTSDSMEDSDIENNFNYDENEEVDDIDLDLDLSDNPRTRK